MVDSTKKMFAFLPNNVESQASQDASFNNEQVKELCPKICKHDKTLLELFDECG